MNNVMAGVTPTFAGAESQSITVQVLRTALT